MIEDRLIDDKMRNRIKELAKEAYILDAQTITGWKESDITDHLLNSLEGFTQKFAELIIRECIDEIENHQIPVGNSAAGEMACEWTYDALKEIRANIKEKFGIE